MTDSERADFISPGAERPSPAKGPDAGCDGRDSRETIVRALDVHAQFIVALANCQPRHIEVCGADVRASRATLLTAIDDALAASYNEGFRHGEDSVPVDRLCDGAERDAYFEGRRDERNGNP